MSRRSRSTASVRRVATAAPAAQHSGSRRWSLRQQFLWVPDLDRTSMRAVIVLRITVSLFVTALLTLVVINGVWLVSEDLWAPTIRLNHYRFPWWLGVAFAVVPLWCLTCFGPRARRGSAVFNAVVLALALAAFFRFFSRPYYLIVCGADVMIALILTLQRRVFRR